MPRYEITVGINLNVDSEDHAERIAQSIQDELSEQLASRQAKNEHGALASWDVRKISDD